MNRKDANDTLVVDIREAARLLQVCEKTIYNLAKEGKIQAIKMGKRCVRYTRASLIAFIASCSLDNSTESRREN